MKQIILLSVVILLFATSCKRNEKEEQEKLDAYIAEHNITVKPTAEHNITVKPTESGLYYIETQAGTGEKPVKGSTVQVHYTGTLIDGTEFDSSIGGSPLEFPLGVGYVIAGWDEGIALMKEGGKATLIIPSELGYGAQAAGSIPAYSTLIFDVELVNVLK